jgi:triosephosphate isomerase
MKRYIIANWKCHKTADEGQRWLDRFAGLYRPQPEVLVVVAPTLLSLGTLAAHVDRLGLKNFALAAQDVSPFPRGGYTGAVAADMVTGLARYVIIGHSERRRYFHETSIDVVNKVTEAADARLIPIVCVDGSHALAQLGALEDIECEELLVAYTPVEASSSTLPESPARVSEAVGHIRQMFSHRLVIYGGGLLPGNVDKYLRIPGLSGLLVGESSLDPDAFADICGRAGTAPR